MICGSSILRPHVKMRKKNKGKYEKLDFDEMMDFGFEGITGMGKV